MSRKLQFAAVMLVLVILSAPLLAAVSCLGGTQLAAMHCCPAMASSGMAPGLQLAAQHRGGSCCDVSNSKPSPVAAVQAPVTPAGAVSQIASATPGLAPATVRESRQQSQALRFPDSAQSLLCVFLI